MLTIKIYLAESGAVADLHKDFPLFQGQYQNVLLNAFVPVSLLAPNFTVLAQNSNTVLSPYVAGTAVKIGMRTIARNGRVATTDAYYMQFVKTLIKDGKNYALFERKMPKEFSYFAGNGDNAPTLIINVENISFGEISSASATSDSLTVSVDLGVVQANLPALTKNYVFTYENNSASWYLEDNAVNLANFGISYTGTPTDQNTITLSIIAQTPSVISILTSQEANLDVLTSSNFGNESMDADDYEAVMGYITAINNALTDKQDKVDNSLITPEKTIVGAINGLCTQIGTGEDYIGTYNYNASSVGDLPSDADLNAFVASVRGAGYTIKNGDTVMVVQKLTGATDKNYKYIYNGSGWGYYEIPPIQPALNGVAGIVAGTYGVGKTYNTLVSIENGEITAIYVKNALTGNYEDLTSAYMPINTGATKQYVKSYALPREFNDALFLTADGYSKTAPETPESGVQFEKELLNLAEAELFTCAYTLEDVEFELSQKNSYISTFYIASSENIEASFRLVTYAISPSNSPIMLNSELLTEQEIETSPQKFSFESRFLSYNGILSLGNGWKISQTLYITPDTANVTVEVYSNTTLPSVFYLNTQTATMLNAEVVQHTGDSRVNVMSQKATTDGLNGKVDKNSAIVGATKTKITYDSKGLVTAGADAGIDDITGLSAMLGTKEDTDNKVTSLSILSTDTQYPSAKCVYDNIDAVRNIANGKCKTYVIKYSEEAPTEATYTGNLYKLDGTRLSAWQDFSNYVGTSNIGNGVFNSQNNSVTVSYNPLDPKYYIFSTSDITYVAKDYEWFLYLKLGDVLLIVETEVPDRWYMESGAFGKLETSKVDLSGYVQKDTTSTFSEFAYTKNGVTQISQSVNGGTIPRRESNGTMLATKATVAGATGYLLSQVLTVENYNDLDRAKRDIVAPEQNKVLVYTSEGTNGQTSREAVVGGTEGNIPIYGTNGVLKAGSPSANNDVVNLDYFNSHSSGGGLYNHKFVISFNTTYAGDTVTSTIYRVATSRSATPISFTAGTQQSDELNAKVASLRDIFSEFYAGALFFTAGGNTIERNILTMVPTRDFTYWLITLYNNDTSQIEYLALPVWSAGTITFTIADTVS